MLNFSRHFYKSRSFLIIERFLSSNSDIPSKGSKSLAITASIRLYLEKCQEKEKLIEVDRKRFEFGRRYLAKMMGADPETFTQEDIDESIRYLLPCGLMNPDARPIMTDPSNIYPTRKPLEADVSGMPLNTFYYTGKPAFYSIMLEGIYLLEHMKSLEDQVNRKQISPGKQVTLPASLWFTHKQLADYLVEKVHPEQYRTWSVLMNTIYNHPFNYEAKEFMSKMRAPIVGNKKKENRMEPMTDPESGRKYVETYGQKKWTLVEVRMYMPGDGLFTINNKRLLEFVPLIYNREAILCPLKFTNTIDKVDIIANVKETGPSNTALALRLAISRALACYLPDEEVMRLETAGLLTQDERYKERKKPGLRKARKRPTWRKR